MRALSTLLVLCLGLLAVALLAPEAAAATVDVGAYAAPSVALAAAGLGAGIVVRLRAQRFDDAGERTTPQSFSLDSDGDSYAADLEAYGDAKVEEGAAPLRAELAATATERDDFRAIAIDEILRVEQLSHTGDDEFNAEEERTYLESLPASKLKLHFKKAREKGVSLTPQTTGEEPAGEVAEAAYGTVKVA